MKKKQYQSPQMKVVKVKAQQMLCGSTMSNLQNESYDEVSAEITDGWFN